MHFFAHENVKVMLTKEINTGLKSYSRPCVSSNHLLYRTAELANQLRYRDDMIKHSQGLISTLVNFRTIITIPMHLKLLNILQSS